jgi:hypothetical protein
MTKLRIDLNEGTLEVEGEEGFVLGVYNDFKEQLSKNSSTQPAFKKAEDPHKVDTTSSRTSSKNAKIVSAKQKNTGSRTMPSIVKDLDLSSKQGKKSLREFHAEKSPHTAMENNALFVYHLRNNLKMDGIGIDHIYTCYKEVNVRPPAALKQSLVDTANRKGWIDTTSLDKITLSLRGETFIDHDLPKKVSKK